MTIIPNMCATTLSRVHQLVDQTHAHNHYYYYYCYCKTTNQHRFFF